MTPKTPNYKALQIYKITNIAIKHHKTLIILNLFWGNYGFSKCSKILDLGEIIGAVFGVFCITICYFWCGIRIRCIFLYIGTYVEDMFDLFCF